MPLLVTARAPTNGAARRPILSRSERQSNRHPRTSSTTRTRARVRMLLPRDWMSRFIHRTPTTASQILIRTMPRPSLIRFNPQLSHRNQTILRALCSHSGRPTCFTRRRTPRSHTRPSPSSARIGHRPRIVTSSKQIL